MDRDPDEVLLKRFVDGDKGAFEALMRRHEDRIFALSLQMTGHRADALEATQDTFLALYRRAGSFRGKSSFSTWLYRVGINTCKDHLRKRARAPVPAEEVPEPESGARPGIDELAALRIDVARALAGLSEDYREAVCLHDLGAVPYEEIAALTGVPIGTVKSRISRARRLLREALEHRATEAPSKSVDDDKQSAKGRRS